MATIVLGYDGSAGSDAALQRAIELASALGDELVIAFGFEPRGGPSEEMGAVRDAVRELGTETAAPAVERARAAGVDARLELVDASPTEALVSLASRHAARMIVVGTRSESPLKGAIVGATPHKLLQVSGVPVLAVPPA